MSATVIETEVTGSPAALREQARWLRRSAAGDLDGAGDRQATARREAASGWEGEAGSAYHDVGTLALRITDDHAARVRRAADAVGDIADRLAALKQTMAGLREEAVAEGLLVLGTQITMPLVSLLAGPQRQGMLGGAVDPARRVFDRIHGEVDRARLDYDDWVDQRLARAREDAAQRDDLDGVLRRLDSGPPPAAPAAPVAPVPPVAVPTGAPAGGSQLAGASSAASGAGPSTGPDGGPPAGATRTAGADWVATTPGRTGGPPRYVVTDHPHDASSTPPRSGAAADPGGPGQVGGTEPVEVGDVRRVEPGERHEVRWYGRPPDR